jgi:hypothetical protein
MHMYVMTLQYRSSYVRHDTQMYKLKLMYCHRNIQSHITVMTVTPTDIPMSLHIGDYFLHFLSLLAVT